MKVLHIVRRADDARAIAIAAAQSVEHEVTVLLVQDGVGAAVDQALKVVACREDMLERGGRATYPTLDYDAIVALIFANDRVITW